jgi:hypothetical protein
MLNLAADKKIHPWIRKRPMKDANATIVDMEAGKARCRHVLCNDEYMLEDSMTLRNLYLEEEYTCMHRCVDDAIRAIDYDLPAIKDTLNALFAHRTYRK